jgi:hypothetical protein
MCLFLTDFHRETELLDETHVDTSCPIGCDAPDLL